MSALISFFGGTAFRMIWGEVSAYFTPDEWWGLGGDRILFEQQNVYKNFLHAMDAYA